MFVNIDQLPQKVYEYVSSQRIRVEPYEDVVKFAKQVGQGLAKSDKVIVPNRTNYSIASAFGTDNITVMRSPVADLKAIKNEVEIEGFRQCHLRDGVALCRYFSWLERTIFIHEQSFDNADEGRRRTWVWCTDQGGGRSKSAGRVPQVSIHGTSDEGSGADLRSFRRELSLFRGLSFDTISSTGANASIIHYKPDSDNSAIIDKNAIYLCDSGAQFADGTTEFVSG